MHMLNFYVICCSCSLLFDVILQCEPVAVKPLCYLATGILFLIVVSQLIELA